MGAIRTIGGVWRSVGGASPSWSPLALAPANLTVAIVEASLAFGDTATAVVSVTGSPAPTLAYQWTLDGVDVEGRTGPTFDGVPVGALRVRVTATNSEGSAEATSDPVAVSPLAPDAFSAGQWAVDANGVSGQVGITLFGLPPENGAAISGVEYAIDGGAWTDFAALAAAAPWADLATTKTWVSTKAAQDWSTTSAVAPFVIYQSPWGAWDMAPGDVFNTELRADQTLSPAWPALRTITGPLQFGAGLPKGAPMIILGAHFDLTSASNPFTTGGLRGIRSDAITEWRAATRVRDRSAPDASLNAAVQTYATVAPTQVLGWADQNTEQWFDIQVRHWWPNFPVPSEARLRGQVTLGGVEYKIYRNPTEGTVRPGDGTIGYGVIPTRQTLLAQHDMKAIIDWIVADHNAVTAQSLPGLYIYQCATWVEPRSGVVDATIEGFEVRFNGVTYGRLNRTEGGVSLDTPYTVAGLTDGQPYTFRLRAVNAVGPGPKSDTKTETPFALAAPETVGDNGWTFQPVASSTDLEVFIAQTPDWTGLSLNVDAEGADVATFAALEAGPVALAVPTITGTPALGATMTAGNGRWASLTGVTSYAYQWERDGAAIGGATASTYDLVSADSNTDLTVVVTATDAQGSTASESAATSIGAFEDAPVSTIPWVDAKYWLTGSGLQTIAMATNVTGDNIVWSLLSPPTGVTINSATGVVSVDTTSEIAWTEITARASNGGGSTDIKTHIRVFTADYIIDPVNGPNYSHWDIPTTSGLKVVWRASTVTTEVYAADHAGQEWYAYPGETVVFDASTVTAANMVSVGSGSGLYGFEIAGGNNANCDFGVGQWGAANVKIWLCNIHNFDRGGIYTGFDNSDYARPFDIRYNRIHANVQENSNLSSSGGWGGGIRLEQADNSIVSRNRVYKNYGEGINVLSVRSATIKENIVWDNWSVNIYPDHAGDCTITNNMIFGKDFKWYRNGNPAISILAAAEEYPNNEGERGTFGLVANNNIIQDGLPIPRYDQYSPQPEGTPAGVYTPNTIVTTIPDAWYGGEFTPSLFPVAYTGLRNANAFEIGGAGWTNNGNISATTLTSVEPYQSPRRVTLTSGTDFFRGRLTSVGSPTSGTPYLVAAIVKAATGGRATLRIETTGGTLLAQVYTTDFTSVSGSSGPIANTAVTDVGGGYVRISCTYTPASTQATNIKIGPAGGATNNAVDVYGCGMAEAV